MLNSYDHWAAMTPYPNAPAPWHQPPPPPPIGVGVGVKVLAGIQCFFGGLGILLSPFTLLQRNTAKDAVSKAIFSAMWDGPMAIYSWFQLAIGILLAGALLASGIGLFMSKRWARTLGLIYGVAALVMLVVGQLVTIIVVYPVLTPFLDSTNAVERAGAIGGLAGGAGGACVAAILPVAMLIVLGRKSMNDQLRD